MKKNYTPLVWCIYVHKFQNIFDILASERGHNLNDSFSDFIRRFEAVLYGVDK